VADGGPNASASGQYQRLKSSVPTPLVTLVTGSAGNQGGAVARRLLERGRWVCAFSRSADSSTGRELERPGAKRPPTDVAGSQNWSGLMGARVLRGREVGPAGRGA
jgi:NADP-dependent 3-hydroxy acid dehydrogenase YdfG